MGQVIQGYFVGGSFRQPGVLLRRASATAGPATGAPPPALGGHAGDMGGVALQRRTAPGRPAPVHAAGVVQARGANDSFAIDPVQVGLARGGGQPLPPAVLAKMEAAFATDFSGVRVHIGPQASRIGAIAFTTGSDLYFAPGQYQPDSVKGQQLIGHELAHVVQQRQGRVRAPGNGVSVVQDHALEAEADRLGMRAAAFVAPVRRSPERAGHGPGRRAGAFAIQPMMGRRSTVDLSAYATPQDIPGYDSMGLESVGGGGSFDFFSGTGSFGEYATAFVHGVGNAVWQQGRWANILGFTHGSKDSGRVAVSSRARVLGDYNPTTVSATQHIANSAHRPRGLNMFGTAHQWCHLVASSLGGSNAATNVVSASKWANGEMLAIEIALHRLLREGNNLDVRVRATLAWGDPHLAENIHYEIFRTGGQKIYTRNIDARRSVPLTKAENKSIADAIRSVA